MKLAISILTDRRAVLRDQRNVQSNNATSHYNDAKACRKQAAALLAQAESYERNASRACLARNQLQVQLNELDKAISKLET